MKIRFVDEQAMEKFSCSGVSPSHNKNMAQRFGMNPFKVEIDDTGEFWDTAGGEFTIHIEDESHYFTIIEG